MGETLGTLVYEGDKIILEYYEGYKEVFDKEKPDYTEGTQWIDFKGDRYFLVQD